MRKVKFEEIFIIRYYHINKITFYLKYYYYSFETRTTRGLVVYFNKDRLK